MDNLERKKDNCLQRTYREVGIEFAKVFAELVPGGEGNLLMVGEGGDYTGVKVRWGIFFCCFVWDMCLFGVIACWVGGYPCHDGFAGAANCPAKYVWN